MAGYAIVCLAALFAAPFLGHRALARHRDFTTMSPFEEEGRPVTAKDVAGRKLCWNTGHWAYFMADGSFTNDRSEYFKKRPGALVGAPARRRQDRIFRAPGRDPSERPASRILVRPGAWQGKGHQVPRQDLWGTVCN
jgi:hypothetical protein